MSAIEKLRAIVDTIKNLRVVMPDVANRAIPSGRFALTAADFCELLHEIDRMRADAAETREACARICDERAKSAFGRSLTCSSTMNPTEFVQLTARMYEAAACADAIRAGGNP